MLKYATCFLLIFSISVNSKGQAPSPELTSRQLRNLTAFAKTYGYVRYFHPTKQALQTDWNDFLIQNVTKTLRPETDEELIAFLDSLYSPIAPSIQFSTTDKTSNNILYVRGRVQFWHHTGAGFDEPKGTVYKSKVLRGTTRGIQEKYGIDLSKPYVTELVSGLSIVLPVGVPVKGIRKRPAKQKEEHYSVSDRSVRLAGIIIAWNELQHFYPYWNLTDTNWPTVLNSCLKKAYLDPNDLDYEKTLTQLLIPLNDGHGNIINQNSWKEWKRAPLWAVLAGDKILVESCVDCSAIGTPPGDEIIAIDGVQTQHLFNKIASERSGSPQCKKYYATAFLLVSPSQNDSMQITLRDSSGSEYIRKVPSSEDYWDLRLNRFDPIEEIEEGIYYVSIDRVQNKEFKKKLSDLENAKGIIFELKYYPAGMLHLRHLTNKKITSPRWNVPIILYPDQAYLSNYDTTGRWKIKPKKPYLGDKKIVFITSGGAISYAETCLGIVEHYQLGNIVGKGPTAGTNGNINYIKLPGNFQIAYTGMMVLKHDGSQHHLLGIAPTHPVTITVQSIREERDLLIEKALDLIKDVGP